MARGWRGLALFSVCTAAFAVRAAGFELVFPGDGSVVFSLGDAQYHARLALYSFARFPGWLGFDRYLNYPDGAFVPYPPLHDWIPAALARLAGAGLSGLERTVAWLPVAWGVATLLPLYALGRRLAGEGVGLGAAALFALLPLATLPSLVGNADHHAAVACLAALLLWLVVRALDPRTSPRALLASFAGLVAVRAALLLVWQGSLLHLGPAELALVATGALAGRRELLRGEIWSALAAAALVSPVVATGGQQLGGPLSAIELSWLHPAALAAAAGAAALLLEAERRWPSASLAERAARLAGVCAGGGALLLAFPGARQGLARALAFLGAGDDYAVLEQLPLLPFGRPGARRGAEAALGFAVYLIPLVPPVLLMRAREPALRAAALTLAGWAAVSGTLALFQVRYANDFLPVGCLGFALLVAELADALARRTPRPRAARPVLALLLGAALLAPALPHPIRGLRASLAHLRGDGPGRDRALDTLDGSAARFAQAVRDATPETRGYFDQEPPEYAILASPGLGHALEYYARRPTPADSFGPYIGREHYQQALEFFQQREEERALELARRLGARYVASNDTGGALRPALVYRLHRGDGGETRAGPRLERFRLVTEGPAGGRGLGALTAGALPLHDVPYKLFEIVEGAVLAVTGTPGDAVEARVEIATPTGRRFQHVARGEIGPGGELLLRVPYATAGELPAHALGPYRLVVGERVFRVQVPERAVREGRRIEIPSAASR
jgi:asparagine N-glycosylation enzyme membrane subunit Stt3